MIQESHGNLLEARADALVNTVNTVGVMGKGIALQFKRAYPENFKAYKRACDQGEIKLGRVFIWDAGGLAEDGPRYIVNFPTKGHWRSRSKLVDIRAGLADLVEQITLLPIGTIAVPPLGCGYGGLRWDQVRPLIEKAFEPIPEVTVLLYPPEGAPSAAEQPVRTARPKMTPGRAALIVMMQRYLPYAVEITAVDIQKLMYFVQESGENLRLNYAKGRYGPYADNLRHVLGAIEGHYIRGTGDGSAKALDSIPFQVLEGARSSADALLESGAGIATRVERVTQLIEGFESTYGLELLATVHWAAKRDEGGGRRDDALSVESVEEVVISWNVRKGRLFTSRHIAVAYERLRCLGWFDPPPIEVIAS